MKVPILRQGPHLIATIQSAPTDRDLLELRDSLVASVGADGVRGVVVDVTAIDVMDSFASRTLSDLARALRLAGAETVIVGIQPEIAFTMARLGLTFKDVPTALDLEEGLAYLGRAAPGRS